ncbi:PHD finger protein 19 [Coemansia sp. IMI 209128]|nr:PHD finger protein 19 [Coemansia sp. RSA 2530]KAJ2695796.1 PHD finger protein 19 [Coemansia sp. IMI 209128]
MAVNAYPPLAAELVCLTPTAVPKGDMQAIQEVFAAHGGEKFGEKDNNQDLAAIRRWLSEARSALRPTPDDTSALNCSLSIYRLLDALLPHCGLDARRMVLLTVDGLNSTGASAAHGLDSALGRQWSASNFSALVPSLLFVRGSMPVSVLDGMTAVDLSSCGPVENRLTRGKELEAARRKYVDAMSVCATVGIPEKSASGHALLHSIQALTAWLSSSSIEPLARATDGSIVDYAQLLGPLMAGSMPYWEKIAARIDEKAQASKQALLKLERTRHYVLRAFIVEGEPLVAGGEKQLMVVRRFGKAQGASHYSVLGSDGVCWPTRLKDVPGTVVESMWVCCSDDDECRAKDAPETSFEGGNSQSGLNTVVADPDDEIFCHVCHYIDSWSYNQIIICDGCERGVHQLCHVPVVTESELTQDQWFCQSCKPDLPRSRAKRVRSK